MEMFMKNLKWWQRAVFYQIYPRSFADGNGDGIGDLAGMIEKLDYLKDLGIDAIWLSPHYPSPQFDCGYDISDYTNVDADYGTLEQFKTYLDEVHQRGMRLILDLVLNHTSDQHPWFIESRSSRDNPKRDWYVWHDGINGKPPNNWNSTFGGPAWEWDEKTQSYYYHFFFKEQPDLNWRNPEVKKAMFDAVRFWLDMGVDGFRLDAIGTIYEDPALPNHPVKESLEDLFRGYRQAETHDEWLRIRKIWEEMFSQQADQPGMHELMRELRALVDDYDDRMLVGETEEISFYGNGDDELHMVFNFPLMMTPRITPEFVRANQLQRLGALPAGAWPCNTLGNHDSPRILSRYGDGVNNEAIARVNLALMLTLKGTPFLYNGEEIGMSDYLLSDIADVRDNLSWWAYHLEKEVFGSSEEEATRQAFLRGRDKCRTPNQWGNAAHGGFCPAEVRPWLAVNPDYAQGVNVADQEEDAGSMLNFYRSMLKMRRRNSALISGDFKFVNPGPTKAGSKSEGSLAFTRTCDQQRLLVVLNMSNTTQQVAVDLPLPEMGLVFSSHQRDRAVQAAGFEVQPYEVFIGQY
jgi:alpha-glucosidase